MTIKKYWIIGNKNCQPRLEKGVWQSVDPRGDSQYHVGYSNLEEAQAALKKLDTVDLESNPIIAKEKMKIRKII